MDSPECYSRFYSNYATRSQLENLAVVNRRGEHLLALIGGKSDRFMGRM